MNFQTQNGFFMHTPSPPPLGSGPKMEAGKFSVGPVKIGVGWVQHSNSVDQNFNLQHFQEES